MGGYGSGGHNRKHKLIRGFGRIDSYKDRDIPEYIHTEKVKAGIRESDYYICPVCKNRVRYLYDIKDHYYFVCSKCLQLNYESQSLPKDELAVMRAKEALQAVGIDIADMTPWDIMHISPDYVRRKAGKDSMEEAEKFIESVKTWYSCFPV